MKVASHPRQSGSFVLCLLCLLSWVAPLQAGDARIVAGISSSQKVLEDLEHLVVTLADKSQSWENNVYPNIEIFLIGVSETDPVRFDVIFSPAHGQQLQPAIPVSDLNEFIDDNLVPIDIVPKRSRQDRDLYEITGTVMEGWMRYLAKPSPLVVIYPQQEAIPKGMPHPADLQEQFIENGELVFWSLKNSAEDQEDRRTAWNITASKELEEFQKFPEESRNAFELRKRLREQSLSFLEQLLVETGEARWWLKLDREASEAPSQLQFSALPETALAETVARIRTEPGRFSQVAKPENALLTLRGNIPIERNRALSYREIYELARPVLEEKIDEKENANTDEQAARKEVAGLLLDVLSATAELAVIDGFLDVLPAGESHAAVLGIRCAGQEQIQQIFDKLPATNAGWELTRDVDQVGELKIHQLSLGDETPNSLKEFFGDSGKIFLATSEQGFWMAGGEGSLELLKERIETLPKSVEAPGDGVMLSLDMNARPLLKLMHDFTNESELTIIQTLKQQRNQLRESKVSEEEAERPGQRTASNLSNFEWQETAIAVLEGEDDRVKLLFVSEEEGALSGSGNVHKGMLKALGTLIAKFSDENLQ